MLSKALPELEVKIMYVLYLYVFTPFFFGVLTNV